MSVHYKFKSTLDFDTITFDGLHISVGDLKRSIVKQKHLGKLTDFDLQITNAQTKEEYTDDNSLIPKNTSLIIARVPLSHQSKKSWDNLEKNVESRNTQKMDNVGLDISKMKGSEEEKIHAMMLQSTAEYDPKSYQKIRSQPQTGEVPPTYRCNKCKKGGHWIKNCPFNLTKEFSEVKRNTGIPKSFQNRDEKQLESEKQEQPLPIHENQQEIPEDLICSMCHDLFTDAVMVPCCGSSFCDDCVRTALLESEDNECPDCKEKGSSPASLIPNRFLRNSVNAFKNATGYKANEIKRAERKEVTNCNDNSEKTVPEAEIKNANVEIQSETSAKENVNDDTVVKTVVTNAVEEQPVVEQSVEKPADAPVQDDVESDFEDNITIKMPPTQIANQSAPFREKAFNGRNMRHPKPPGLENSPQRQIQDHADKKRSPTRIAGRVEWDRDFRESCGEQNTFEVPSHIGHSSDPYNRDIQDRRHRPANAHEMFPGPVQRLNMGYQHMQSTHLQMNPATPMQTPHHLLPFNNVYNQMDPRANMSFPNFVRQPFPNIRPGCVPMRGPPTDVRQGITANSNLASVYQGVAAKVGTGIIDDPLEAFNRIMKEKEKRKEERRRTPEQRRSRSPDRHQRNRYRTSPVNRRPPREQISREKHEHFRDKHDRRERDRYINTNRDRIFRHKRSTSFSDRSSRSRSWSVSPHRRRSRSPVHYRRSRSRPQNFNDKSRSYGRNRSQHVTKHILPEEKNIKRDMRSPSLVKRGEELLPSEGNKKHIVDVRPDTLEPPPPGFEAGPSANYQWSQNEKNVYHQSPDTYDQNTRVERKKSDSKGERSRSPSKSSSYSNEKKTLKNASKSPLKRLFEDKRNDNLITSKDEEETHQQNNRENKDLRIVKQDKDRRNALTPRDKLQSQYIKNPTKKSDKEMKPDESVVQADKKDIPSPKMTYAILEKKFEKHENKDILKSEKRKGERERKKKSKKEKVDKRKLRKDKKEKRDRNKHISSTNEKDYHQETKISTEELKNAGESTSNTVSSPERTERISNKNKSEKQFEKELEENRLTEAAENIHFSYDDIENQLKSDFSQEEENAKSTENLKSKRSTPPETFNRFDSVLDIHGYDTDFDETKPHQNQNDKTNAAAPVLSKWEIDEQKYTPQVSRLSNEINTTFQSKDSLSDDKVTDEVLRKAEHAIFARAINAIRPIEGKKHSSIERSPPSNQNKQKESSKGLKDFQITIPLGSTHERSVELKPEKSRNLSHSPKRTKPSIKDRLGSKIVHKDQSLSSHSDADFHKQEKSRKDRSNDRNTGSNIRDYSSSFRERGRERERERERGRSKERNHSGSNVKKMYGSNSNLMQRNRDGKKEENFDYHKEYDREKESRYNERDTRNVRGDVRKLDERLQSQRSKNDYFYANRSKRNDFDVNFGSNTKHSKRHTNEQNISHMSGGEKGESNDQNSYEINYLNPSGMNPEQSRVTTNPFRKNVDISDLKLNSSGERDKRKTYIPSKQSCSSSGSDTDEGLDDSKRKKKHKDRKERKRVKRSSSLESTESARKKHKKKKNKSSKKKKKNKKHHETST